MTQHNMVTYESYLRQNLARKELRLNPRDERVQTEPRLRWNLKMLYHIAIDQILFSTGEV